MTTGPSREPAIHQESTYHLNSPLRWVTLLPQRDPLQIFTFAIKSAHVDSLVNGIKTTTQDKLWPIRYQWPKSSNITCHDILAIALPHGIWIWFGLLVFGLRSWVFGTRHDTYDCLFLIFPFSCDQRIQVKDWDRKITYIRYHILNTLWLEIIFEFLKSM